MGLNLIKKFLRELNKRGVSATVVAVILVIVGLAILMVFIISVSRSGGDNIQGIVNSLETVKQG